MYLHLTDSGPTLAASTTSLGQRFRDPAIACLTIYLVLSAFMYFYILHLNGGHFSYTMDDPYIHLSLSERLAHGGYGINEGEFASPCSSILWPFLLLPAVGTAVHQYLPLIYNLIFASLSAWLIGVMARRWTWLLSGSYAVLKCWCLAFLLDVGANLVGLTFTGMEHLFEVFLAVVCGYAVLEAYEGRSIPKWCIALVLIAPSVRYESYVLCLALAVALVVQKRRWTAAMVLTASLIVPVIFAIFLVTHGQAPLPNSVLAKGAAYASNRGMGANLLFTMKGNMLAYLKLTDWHRSSTTLLLPVLAWVTWTRRENRKQFIILAGVTVAFLLEMLAGNYDLSHRYEVFMQILAILVFITALVPVRRDAYILFVVVVLLLADRPYLAVLHRVPQLSQNIYLQQYQMHRFAQLYGGNFAANDIGWVSYQLPRSTYMLDLAGLASTEALRQINKDDAWMDDVTRRHQVGLVMIYPDWFTNIPPDWKPVASLLPTNLVGSLGHHDVYFFETPYGTPESRMNLAANLATFAQEVPPGAKLTLNPPPPDRSKAQKPIPAE